MHFAHYRSSEGLPQQTVTCIMQDSRGFLWVGTREGLCRFDGSRFMVYREMQGNIPVLSDDFISALHEDRHGLLWIGTWHGLTSYDPKEQQWTRYRHDPTDPRSLSDDRVTAFHEDADGVLWIATCNGLNRLTVAGNFERVKYRRLAQAKRDSIWSLAGDARGRLWIGTANDGLHTYDPASGTGKPYTVRDTSQGLPATEIRSLLFDRDQRLWIGSGAGATVLHKDGRIEQLHFEGGDNQRITALINLREGGVCMGVLGAGVLHWSAPGVLERHYRHDETIPGSLSTNYVLSIFEDRSGNVWTGTSNGGLNRCNLLTEQFSHLRNIGGGESRPEDRMVWALTTTNDGSLWIATDYGIHIRTSGQGQWRYIGKHAGAVVSSRSWHTWSLLTDSKGRVWAGGENGLDCYQPKGDRIERIPVPYTELAGNQIFTMLESKDGSLWIGSDHGVYVIPADGSALRQYLGKSEATGAAAVQPWCMLESSNGKIWIGTNVRGFYTFDPEKKKWTHYDQEPGGISSSSITCMLEADDGSVWMGSVGGGLHRVDSLDMHITRLTEQDGLANNTVYGLLQDEAGRFWMSSNHGISVYDPRDRSVINFRVSDGLQAEEFNQGAAARGPDGRMYFGGGNGINSFIPSQIKRNRAVPPVAITAVNVQQRRRGGLVLLPQTSGVEYELSAGTSFLTIDFAALDLTDPERNEYSWMMEGVQDTWTDSTHMRRAMFPGLTPGRYTFKVRGSNNHGAWNNTGAQITFIIPAPWYATTWFRILVVLLLIAVVVLIVRSRRRANRRRFNEQAQQQMQLTAELRSREDELLVSREALAEAVDALRSTQTKLTYASKLASLGQMTAGIAHEIKNPINFVNNFAFSSIDIAQELREELEEGDSDEGPLAERIAPLIDELVMSAEKISEHGARVDRIVRSMLLHSHGKAGEAEPVKLNEFLDQYVTLAFHGMRAQVQDFTVEIIRDYDDSITTIPLVQQDVARVFVNLLNNAFQAVNEKAGSAGDAFEPTVHVTSRRVDNFAVVRVEDNGNGVPEHLQQKIFEPFFTTKAAGSGTGLGLSLSHEVIVKGHGGKLRYETSELGGACFVISLPLN
ncbi:GHKL domain-containing protein [bacterium]|nr:GHKL domain-containing protein [bacterium]